MVHIAVCILIILMINENVPHPLPPPPQKKEKQQEETIKQKKKVSMMLILPNRLKEMNEGFLVFHCWLFHIRMKYE